MEIKKSMMLVTSTWSNTTTFKMIPVSTDCPYNEAIYDPEVGILAIVSKDKKQGLKMTPKLNELGDYDLLKNRETRSNLKPYKEQRVSIETYYEYHIQKESEIKSFVNSFAFNADSFDIEQYLKKEEEENK